MRRGIIFLSLFVFCFSVRPAFAARTCCSNQYDEKTCDICIDNGKYWTNFKDRSCANPTENAPCQASDGTWICPSDRQYGNACGGGGGGAGPSCQFYGAGPFTFSSTGAAASLNIPLGASGGLPTNVTFALKSTSAIAPTNFRLSPSSDAIRTNGYYNTTVGPAKSGTPIAAGTYVIKATGYYDTIAKCTRDYAVIITPPVTPTPSPTPAGTLSPTPTPTPVPTPTPLVTLSSTIETDPSLSGGVAPSLVGLTDPYCSSPNSGTPYSTGSIHAKDASGKVYPGSISGGTYTIQNLPQAPDAYCVTFTPSSPSIVCTCPVGCTYCGKDAPTTQPLKFYVSPVGSAWFQTVGGEVAAMNTSGKGILDLIPQTCLSPGCLPYLSLPFLSDMRSTGALITHRASSVDLSDASGSQAGNVSSGVSRNVRLNEPIVCTENYEYFYRLFSLGLSPSVDFAYPLDLRKPNAPPSGGKLAYFAKAATLTISAPWSVGASESIVVFVNGNLKIANTVEVARGGFLAFIVSGSISVDKTLGTSDHASTGPGQVQGIYITNGSFRVEGNTAGGEEKKLIGEGTFAACGGIKLDRDYARGGAGLDNNTYPSTLFTYRPDLVQHTPERMKTSSFVWREINP